MSGIVGSKDNIRGSGIVAKLGTDGQIMTSAGAGVSAVYEDAAAGGTSWQSVVTASTLAAVSGNGYPINTTSNACTVTLPASPSVGDFIEFTDYARNWGTNAVTFNLSSLKYQGNTTPVPVYDTSGESLRIVYVDVTQGWIPVNDGAKALETPQTVEAEYLVVGGGASSGAETAVSSYCHGGGAGGYRTNYGSTTVSITPGQVYTMTVGTGGAAVTSMVIGNAGVASSIAGTGIPTVGLVSDKITASGGGYGSGGSSSPLPDAGDGGSGGGNYYGGNAGAAGSGNVGGDGGAPSIPEGFDGAKSATGGGGGGGGGASEVAGADGLSTGGDGLSNSITGSAVFYAGGGSACVSTANTAVVGGQGGGGAGARFQFQGAGPGVDGLGGGGGGQDGNSESGDGPGGDGVIFLRVPTAGYSGTQTNGTVTTDGSDTIIKWLATGTYTA